MTDSRPSIPCQPAVRHRNRAVLVGLVASACAAAMLAGCSGSPRTEQPFENLGNAFAGMLKNPFHGPSEAGFLALVEHHCADFSVGDSSVGALLDDRGTFRDLTLRLYGGDLSNDEYINQVLELHPAEDANVPATGCIIDQLQECFSGRCEVVEEGTQPPPPETPQELAPEVDGEAPASPGPSDGPQLDADPPAETPTPLP